MIYYNVIHVKVLHNFQWHFVWGHTRRYLMTMRIFRPATDEPHVEISFDLFKSYRSCPFICLYLLNLRIFSRSAFTVSFFTKRFSSWLSSINFNRSNHVGLVFSGRFKRNVTEGICAKSQNTIPYTGENRVTVRLHGFVTTIFHVPALR